MITMKPYKTRHITSAVGKKGFFKENTDHEKWFFWSNGKRTSLWLKISHGQSECKQREIRGMLKTLRMTQPDFEKVIECSWGLKEIETHLQKVMNL